MKRLSGAAAPGPELPSWAWAQALPLPADALTPSPALTVSSLQPEPFKGANLVLDFSNTALSRSARDLQEQTQTKVWPLASPSDFSPALSSRSSHGLLSTAGF